MVRSPVRAVVRAALCLGALVLTTRVSHAGVILFGAAEPFPPGSITLGLPSTGSPGNDDTNAPFDNYVQQAKEYTALSTFDVEFTVANSGSTTEYIIDEATPLAAVFGVSNDTGVEWTGYRFELGFGLGASFVRSSLLDGLDFDVPGGIPPPGSLEFSTVDHQPDLLGFAGGSLADPGIATFVFALDVPDFNSQMPEAFAERDSTGAITGYRFTLRQFPITAIPEPASLLLLGAGLSGLTALRGRRRGR